MKEDYIDSVYETLCGLLMPEYRIPGVENAFASGEACEQNYAQMLEAYERLCDRLGVVDEDDDVEVIINALLKNERILCRKMFEYGFQYGQNKSQL